MRIPNDMELANHVTRLRFLSRHMAEPRQVEEFAKVGDDEMALFLMLSEIEKAAHAAQIRMNDLIYGRGYKPPQEPMGG